MNLLDQGAKISCRDFWAVFGRAPRDSADSNSADFARWRSCHLYHRPADDHHRGARSVAMMLP